MGRRAVQRAPRIGLYKPWAASMDEGWTRLVLDRYEYKHTSLDNAAMKQKNLGSRFDVIVLADIDKNVIVEGKPRSEEGGYFESLPPPYAGGIGKDGVAALKGFVEGGGTLVCLGSSADLALDELGLPVRNAVAKAKSSEFSLPGTLVNLEVDPSHPLGVGDAGERRRVQHWRPGVHHLDPGRERGSQRGRALPRVPGSGGRERLGGRDGDDGAASGDRGGRARQGQGGAARAASAESRADPSGRSSSCSMPSCGAECRKSANRHTERVTERR